MTKEYRKSLRMSCSVPVILRFIARETRESWGTIYDISLGGLKLETRMPLTNGEMLFLSFVLGDNYLFENTRGTVVRVSSHDGYFTAGIQFSLPIDRTHLRDGLHSLLDLEPAP